jgi:hypothetical protein
LLLLRLLLLLLLLRLRLLRLLRLLLALALLSRNTPMTARYPRDVLLLGLLGTLVIVSRVVLPKASLPLLRIYTCWDRRRSLKWRGYPVWRGLHG